MCDNNVMVEDVGCALFVGTYQKSQINQLFKTPSRLVRMRVPLEDSVK